MKNTIDAQNDMGCSRLSGIAHSLRTSVSVVAASAFLAVGATAHAQTPLHHWTFEGTAGTPGDTGTWWQDKIGSLNLTTTSGTVSQLTLPATGAGSAFPNPIPQTGGVNDYGVNVSAGWIRPADTNAFNGRSSFTVEGFVNLTDVSATNVLNTIRDASGSQFQLSVNNAGVLRAVIYDPTDGSFDATINSSLTLAANVDYYFGIGVSSGTDAADRFLTFHLQDLTNSGALQSNTVSLATQTDFTSLYQSTTMQFRIGESNNIAAMADIRYSDGILDTGSLLAIPEPSAAALLIGMMGLGLVIVRRRLRN